jgi:hypothetical protein
LEFLLAIHIWLHLSHQHQWWNIGMFACYTYPYLPALFSSAPMMKPKLEYTLYMFINTPFPWDYHLYTNMIIEVPKKMKWPGPLCSPLVKKS